MTYQKILYSTMPERKASLRRKPMTLKFKKLKRSSFNTPKYQSQRMVFIVETK